MYIADQSWSLHSWKGQGKQRPEASWGWGSGKANFMDKWWEWRSPNRLEDEEKEETKVILRRLEQTMKVMEEKQDAAKEEACSAKERIERLEAEIKRSEPRLNRQACSWHRDKPGSAVEIPYQGDVQKNIDNWINHLCATLFVKNIKVAHNIWAKLKPVHARNEVDITACRTIANRFFHVECLECGQCVYGDYGTWTADGSPTATECAMHDLAQFLNLELQKGENPQT